MFLCINLYKIRTLRFEITAVPTPSILDAKSNYQLELPPEVEVRWAWGEDARRETTYPLAERRVPLVNG